MLTDGGSADTLGTIGAGTLSVAAGIGTDFAVVCLPGVANSATKPPARKAAKPTSTHNNRPLLGAAADPGLCFAMARRSSSIWRRLRMTTVFSVRSERRRLRRSWAGGDEVGDEWSEITMERASSVTWARGLGTCAPCW